MESNKFASRKESPVNVAALKQSIAIIQNAQQTISQLVAAIPELSNNEQQRLMTTLQVQICQMDEEVKQLHVNVHEYLNSVLNETS